MVYVVMVCWTRRDAVQIMMPAAQSGKMRGNVRELGMNTCSDSVLNHVGTVGHSINSDTLWEGRGRGGGV